MKTRKIKLWCSVISGVAVLVAVALCSLPVFAATISKDSLLEKSALSGLYHCYQNGRMREKIEVSKYTGPAYLYAGDTTVKVAFPSGFTDRDRLTCTEVLAGVTDKNKGSNAYAGLASSMGSLDSLKTPTAVGRFLSGMGYNETSGDAGEQQSCAIFTYDTTIDSPDPKQGKKSSVNKTTVCLETQDGKIASNKATVAYSISGGLSFDKTNQGLHFATNNGNVECNFFGIRKSIKVNFQKGDTWQSFYDNLLSSGCAKEETIYASEGDASLITQHRSNVENNSAGAAASMYVFPTARKHGAAVSAIKTLSNNKYSSYEELAFNEEEKVVLLHSYLNNYYKVASKGCDLTGDSLSLAQGDGYKAARMFDKESNSFKTCYVKAQEHANDKVYTWDSKSHINMNNQMNFDAVLNALNSFKITKLSDPSSIDSIAATEDDGTTGGDSSIAECFTAAESLGWIICPVIKGVGAVIENLYNNVIEHFLQIDPGSFQIASGNKGIYEGWKTFRNFANTLFAIALIIVILAQVTGIGISNYNIKKILPRLIVVIILVNVSLIICQLAVDVSNLLGYGLNTMFEDFANKVGFGNETGAGAIAGTFLSFLGLAGGVAGGVEAFKIFMGGVNLTYWVFPILIGLLGCLIGVFMFFVILAVRQAGVILLAVVAPLAIVCYALPNTKSLFDRWLKAFESLLLVYPICGLMMGGGKFASALLVSAGSEAVSASDGQAGPIYMLVAMLISVVPFFFIPTVLRGSLKAIGDIGTKLSRRGDAFRTGVQKRARDSRFMTERRQEYERNSNIARNKRIIARNRRRVNRLNAKDNLGVIGQRSLKAAQFRLNRATGQNERATKEELLGLENSYTQGYEGINVGNASEMGAEHGRLLEALARNPEDYNSYVRLQAVQNIMGKRGEHYHEAMRANYANLIDSGDPSLYNSVGARRAATHLADNFGGAIKKGDRSFDKMLVAFQSGGVSLPSQQQASEYPALRPSEIMYDDAGANGYTSANLNDVNIKAFDRFTQAATDGRLRGSALQQVAETMQGAFTKDNISLKPEVASKANEFLTAAYAAGGIARTARNKAEMTDGARAMLTADNKSLNHVLSGIREGTLSGAMASQIAENARRARESDDIQGTERAELLEKIVEAADKHGVQPLQDQNGNSTEFSKIEPTTIKLRGGAADTATNTNDNANSTQPSSTSIPAPAANNMPPAAPQSSVSPQPAPAPTSQPIVTPQQPSRPSNMPTLDTPPQFIVNADNTISGGTGPFRANNATVTDSGIIVANERPRNIKPPRSTSNSNNTNARGNGNSNDA